MDGTIRRFDVRAGSLYTDDIGQSVTSIALSHDNLCILSACLDSRVKLLDKASGVQLAEYSGNSLQETTKSLEFLCLLDFSSDSIAKVDHEF